MKTCGLVLLASVVFVLLPACSAPSGSAANESRAELTDEERRHLESLRDQIKAELADLENRTEVQRVFGSNLPVELLDISESDRRNEYVSRYLELTAKLNQILSLLGQ